MKASADTHICIFARYPVPGEAKTRLIPALGPEGAARLHRRMTEHAVATARAVGQDKDTAVTVCFTGRPRRNFRAWLGSDLLFEEQPPDDLGERLHHAFASAFYSGAKRALAIGSDVPGVSPVLLRQALRALDDHDVVLGPASDGGYYLLGMKRLHPGLFLGVDWGTDRVCAQTRGAIRYLKLTMAGLPTLDDIDRPGDIDPLRNDSRFADVLSGQPLLSVIIPTLNEEAIVARTVETVLRTADVEVIVSDGGSGDATREIAVQASATVIEATGGRAAQQNAGATAARGRHLLFLHADTIPPENHADLVRSALDEPGTVAGAFRFRTDVPGRIMRVIEWGTNIRSSIFQWPYGDQGLFMEKRVFTEMGGFTPLPVMEDFDFVRRLRRRGRIVTLHEEALTSGRRWQAVGPLRTTLRNQAMIAGFLVGVRPERLARFYRSGGRKP